MGKGGSSPPPQPTQVSQLTIPEYAQPYMEKLLGKSEALTEQPLPSYQGERRAAPSQSQLDLYKSVSQMQTPGGFKTAQDMAKFGGSEALRLSQYTPTQFQMLKQLKNIK